ncbi:hypothetical protein SAMN06273567_11511 [Geodermatophilus aquaeductus]|uniref:Fibronectin type-III domain-containing protein n=1 Tax=Geodermatophilus aquaeductus TaxID=1564161 RepID=A0A521FTW7_9ACTN|nr:hypothetical protein SAMN06273567_11511 [Geodermatophilus aquaeductus]
MLPPLDGNDYRKRVLAAIEARGGPDASDPFEVYDLPLDGLLPDDDVARRVGEVWAFWQKQRDHPKYRGLVTALLQTHDALAAQLRTADGRARLAEQTRAERARREAARYAELDAALQRLVERFGGVPADKVEGLRGLAAAAGIDDAAFEARLRRHRQLGSGPAAGDAVLRQVRDGLEELGRIEGARVPSLHAFLELPPTADRDTVRRRRDALVVLNRQRRPDRRRALVDDLLVAVGALLVDGDPDAYLDALAADVREALRPRVAAAVLVEDRLTPADAAVLVQEAMAAGLDPQRASAVVTALAGEAGSPVTPPPPPPAVRPGGTPDWSAEVSAARAALRAGRPRAAARHAAAALAAAGGMHPPIRAAQDEAAEVAARAEASWRTLAPVLAARRHAAAAATLERLAADAADVPGPAGEDAAELLATSRAALAAADAALAAAPPSGPGREAALLAALGAVADHPAAQAELAALGVAPATGVVVAPAPGGAREVRWTASASPGPVGYRVLRVRPDGTRQVVGSTATTALEDGGYGPVAGYVVVASRLGVVAPEAVSGETRPPAAAPVSLPPVTGLALAGDRLRWTWPSGCTEVVVLLRPDAPPADPDDPVATRRKVTNARYEIDGGFPVPGSGHVAVFPCTRDGGRLVVSAEGARLRLG